MAAARPAGGQSSSENDHTDLYSDLYSNDEDLDKIAEANELFDAVLTGRVDQDKGNDNSDPFKTAQAKEKDHSEDENKPKKENLQKRLSLYVGNFPWWTSDTDLTNIARRMGVKDIIDIKFAENRVNGQSRGFAEVSVTSEESLKILMDKFPQSFINGQKLKCRFATLQNLAVFEEVANKCIPMRAQSSSKESESEEKPATSRESSAPPISPLFPPLPLANMFPSTPNPFLGQPPPLFSHLVPPISPLMPPHMFPLHPAQIAGQPPPGLAINPAFFLPSQDGHSSKSYGEKKQASQSPDGDFEELMNRNKTIASSAITKAVSGATAGDQRMAMETLLTAIAIIKQSRVYEDERCQALVTSLKDCLVSINGDYKNKRSSRSRESERERDRYRSRDRDHERDRDRHRDRESAGSSRRRRERSWSGERDGERSRERHRDYRDRY